MKQMAQVVPPHKSRQFYECERKKPLGKKKHAKMIAARLKRLTGKNFYTYKCPHGHHYHVTKVPLEEYAAKMKTKSATFILREKGIDRWPALTVELQAPYKEDFVQKLKLHLPQGARIYDQASEVWRLHPGYYDDAIELAKQFYPGVFRVDGQVTTDLVTGRQTEQPSLFN